MLKVDKVEWRRRWIRWRRRNVTGRNVSTVFLTVGVAVLWSGLKDWSSIIATCFVGVALIVYGLIFVDVSRRQ